jgi:Cu(I)-responsive transcriptional regulator
MNIGQAAKASGVSAKMIRHYEGIGLIQAADRAMSGYRVYGTREVETLRFIRRARDLNFSTEQIKELLSLWQDRSRASADVKRFALEHVAILEVRMRDLQEMVGTLKHLASHCHGDDRPDCPIISDLSSGQVAAARPEQRRRAGPTAHLGRMMPSHRR